MSEEADTSSSSSSSSFSGSFFNWANDVASKANELAEKASVEASRLKVKASEWEKEASASLKQGATDFVEKSQRLADDIARKANEVNLGEMVLGVNMQADESASFMRDRGPSSSKETGGVTKVLDMSYITENIIQMSFPYDAEAASKNGGNNIYGVADLLERRHKGHYMIWNISEEAYDYNLFDNQVLEYKFPGHPSPPLGLMFNICTSMESWLDADDKNVAVVHCLTGKGRSASLLACVLTWLGEFSSPSEALQYIADRRNIAVDFLTIPSQRRYVQYFSNMLDGVRPQPHHLLLRRAIMNDVPAFVQQREVLSGGKGPDGGNLRETVEEPGCCPYVQLFKNGKMIATAVPVNHDERTRTLQVASRDQLLQQRQEDASGGKEEIGNTPAKLQKPKLELKWVPTSEGTATFSLDCAVQGDILLRCRHAELVSGQRVSMFRAAFHTGYVPSGVLRLTKAQLDGAGADPRFTDEFFLDLIFAPIEPNCNGGKSDAGNNRSSNSSNCGSVGEEKQPTDSGIQVEGEFSERYEQTLHRDVRFWESIAARKNKAKRRRSRKFVSTTHDQFSIGEDERSNSTEIVFSNGVGSTDNSPDDDLAASNMDLIAALAEAEDFGTGLDADISAETHTSASAAGAQVTGASSPPPSSSAPATAGTGLTTPASVETSNDLAALDELEKELGINGLASAATPAPATPAPDVSIEEEFDELEKYLESLATPSKG